MTLKGAGKVEVKQEQEAVSFTLPAADFGKMLERVIPAATKENGRYAINSIYVECKDEDINVVATDGRRLVVCIGKIEGPCTTKGIIPLNTAKDISKLCSKNRQADIKISVFKKPADQTMMISASIGTEKVEGELFDGIFPKYEMIIPKDHSQSIRFSRRAFLKNIHQPSVVVKLTPGKLSIFKDCQSIDVKGEYNFTTKLNLKYLLDILKAFSQDEILMEFDTPDRPVVFRDRQELIYVLMPMVIRDINY